MRKTLLLLWATVALGFAPAPAYRERPNDPAAVLRRLEGEWRGVSFVNGGRDLFAGRPFRVSLEKDRWRFSSGTDGSGAAHTISLDTRADPVRIDWREGRTHLVGDFAVSGDVFRYNFREAAKGYPRSLTNPAAEDYAVELVRERT